MNVLQGTIHQLQTNKYSRPIYVTTTVLLPIKQVPCYGAAWCGRIKMLYPIGPDGLVNQVYSN